VEEVHTAFRSNVELVYELAEFDRVMLGVALVTLDELQERLKASFQNERLLVTNALAMLRQIKSNDSLRPKYQHIFNQCVVLLVSYFSAAVSDIFRKSFRRGFDGTLSAKLADEDLKLSITELRELDGASSDRIADLFVLKKDISFQDMQSISRTFEKYFDVSMPRDATVNDIIVGQASRHAIIHAGAKVDHKMMLQVAKASPRTLKVKLEEGILLQFSVEEIRTLGGAMSSFVADLETKAIQATS
jgi:hypothetical protein